MTSNAVLIIPPKYEAIIFSASGVKITARRVYIVDEALKVVQSRPYVQADKVSEKRFSELVSFVRSNPV